MKKLLQQKKNSGLSQIQIIALGFFLIIMAGTFLLMLPFSSKGQPASFLTALFTATSATCVTGLVVVDGMQFDRGFISPYMVTDTDKMEAVLDDAFLLITD